ncbi:hypothetical protein [Klebsiella pneumoniae]|uniref:hypothetical protein n=1 Tax=Klebsiella pneumoniae TaxID=573 RepID=UPI0029497043|nr:hypothetical protein [Klebsiella pneumoniae]MDV5422787.1 hypothetical protein [Klebsiella pneumoniae]
MSDKSRAFRLLHKSQNTFVIPQPTLVRPEYLRKWALWPLRPGFAFSLGMAEGQVPATGNASLPEYHRSDHSACIS